MFRLVVKKSITCVRLSGLLYRDRISEVELNEVERKEVDYFSCITQLERTEIEFGRTRRVEVCYPISRMETALRNPACFL